MQGVQVSEVMSRDIAPIPAEASLNEVVRHFQGERFHACPMVDQEGSLSGIVSLGDIDTALQEKESSHIKASDIATISVITVFEDEPMWSALEKMAPKDLSTLPVVDRSDPKRLLGIIRRRDIVRAYRVATLRKMDIRARIAHAKLVSRSGAHFLEIVVSRNSKAIGKRIMEIDLPGNCILVSVIRNERMEIPRGRTKLKEGDRLTVFVERESGDDIRKLFDP